MFRNYVNLAWRNLVRHRVYSTISIIGLLAGITFTLLIGAYVWGELQVNKNLRHSAQQYLLTTQSKDPNIGYELATFGPLAKRLKEGYPSLVKNYYRFDGITSVVSKGDKHFRENLQVGDSTLLTMYGFPLLHGNPASALSEPYSVVITPEKAIKYFGKTDVVGETITIQSFSGSLHDFKITGVLKKVPHNLVTALVKGFPNDFFIPVNTLSYFGRADIDSWQNLFIGSYLELQKGVHPDALKGPIEKLLSGNMDASLKNVISVKPVQLTTYYLDGFKAVVRRMLYTLSFVGMFILLMAMINFVNMAISQSSIRMKEIGVRKVLGSMKRQLVMQFLAESTLLVFAATLLSIFLYPFLRPVFNQVVGGDIPSLTSFPFYFIFVPLLLTLSLGLLAGIYPAFVLSSLKSVESLKGKLTSAKGNDYLRRSLVGLQYCISMIVLIASLVVSQQVAHFFSGSLGYDKEFVVAAQVPRDWTRPGVRKMLTIRDQFAKLPEVSAAALAYEIPNGNNAGQAPVYRFGTDSSAARFAQFLQTDEHYLDVYHIPMKAGSFFAGHGQDSAKVVLNEKAAAMVGFKNAQDAMGQQVRVPGDPTSYRVAGVVSDFHFGSMQSAIAPIIIFNVEFSATFRFMSFKLKPGNIAGSIAAIQKKWAELLPGSSFEYQFMDDALRALYTTEIQLKKAAFVATMLSLIIALLGVFGLIAQSIQKRTKEVGIRKVLGLSVPGIIGLFVKEFAWIILVAALVAMPVAYWLMHSWLQSYVYRIRLDGIPFVLSLLCITLVTGFLVFLQTIRLANANPVNSLRAE